MGMLSGELLNGHLFDSNGLIQKVVDLGPIPELQKLRDKHLYNITPWRDKRGLRLLLYFVFFFYYLWQFYFYIFVHFRLFFSDDEGDSDDDSRLAVTAAWGIRLGRRGSIGLPTGSRQVPDRDRMALDIGLLKKQYDKLRERQRQAHIILTSTARHAVDSSNSSSLPINQYLMGRNAIVSSKGRRIGPPPGAVPPVRKIVATKPFKTTISKQSKKDETLLWKDIDAAAAKTKENNKYCSEDSNFITLQKSPSAASSLSSASDGSVPAATRSRKKSESSSYSEDSDGNSSTSTSLCDDENIELSISSIEASPLRKRNVPDIDVVGDVARTSGIDKESSKETFSTVDISNEANDSLNAILLTDKLKDLNLLEEESEISNDFNIKFLHADEEQHDTGIVNTKETNSIDCDNKFCKNETTTLFDIKMDTDIDPVDSLMFSTLTSNTVCTIENTITSNMANVITYPKSPTIAIFNNDTSELLSDNEEDHPKTEVIQQCDRSILSSPAAITSTSQLSPIADISKYLSNSSISPLRTPSSFLDYSDITSTQSSNSCEITDEAGPFNFEVNDEGVTNEYFERINAPERPSRLELRNSLSFSDNANVVLEPISNKIIETIINTPEINDSKTPIICVDHSISIIRSECSVIPACTELTKITPDKSPLIHKTVLIENMPPPVTNSFFKEKSYSLDEPSHKIEEFRPTSCPESRTENLIQPKNTDRILKIIEENSMILHRILKKNAEETVPIAEFSENNPASVTLDTSNIGGSDETTLLSKYEFSYATKPILQDDIDNDGDISETLSSIKNTIRSIDSLCQYEENNQKIGKKDRDRFSLSEGSIKNIQLIAPVVHVSDTATCPKSIDRLYETESFSSRYSRDKRRDISPRRKRDDEREEYESRFKRDISVTSTSRTAAAITPDFNTLDSTSSNLDKDYSKANTIFTDLTNYKLNYSLPLENDGISMLSKTSACSKSSNDLCLNLNTEDNRNDTNTISKSLYTDKFEIRHTTVTSTFYDRFLSQQKERTVKLDKSPSSPIITTTSPYYFDTLRLPISDRNSKSAETSPARSKYENYLLNHTNATSTYTLATMPIANIQSTEIGGGSEERCTTTNTTTTAPSSPATTATIVKSCENIPDKINNKSELNLLYISYEK